MLLLSAFSASTAAAEEKPINVALFDPIQIVPNAESVRGFRLNILYGSNQDVTGFDLGFIVNRYTGALKGGQMGLVNWGGTGSSVGGQLGTVNLHFADVTGAQLGFVNYADQVTGLQWGFVNYANRLQKGLQIGLVNIARNGFLPVFVITNFNFD